MKIPFQQLSKETLYAVLDEFILREGTDYGHQEAANLEKKRQRLLNQLEKGSAELHYDTETESCTLLKSS